MDHPNSEIVTVSQLTMSIKYHLEQQFRTVWVRGEVTGLSRPNSGHIYLSLKDNQAQIKGVIWRSNAQRIRPDFLDDGIEVVCQGNLDVYQPRGIYQLNIRKIEPVGQGALQLAFQKLHSKLQAEGLFDPAHKRALVRFPKRVAVITSPTGAAVRDFLQVIHRRWSNMEIIIVPVQVQGPGSAEQIENAIYACPEFDVRPDVIVVTRGGGSIEDLWSFNEERVCRAIFNCPIPIICGVGHEVDVTLADLVADVRALTPSEAAERLTPDRREILEMLETGKHRLGLALKNRLFDAQKQLESLASRPVITQPLEQIRNCERELDELAIRTNHSVTRKLESSHNELAKSVGRLESLNPLSVLARGYSLTTNEENDLLVDSKDAVIGDKIHTRLSKGYITSRIEKVE